MIFALIDMGSNTVRLSAYACGSEAAEIHSLQGRVVSSGSESFALLFSKKVMAGLAAYVDDDNKLSSEGIDKARDVLSYLLNIADNVHIDEVHVFATASLRNVSNSAEALACIQKRCNTSVEIVSGEEEALLGYSSFRYDCPCRRGVMADVGGGSSEIVTFEDGEPLYASSISIGSLKLYRKYVSSILPSKREYSALCARIKEELARAELPSDKRGLSLVGIGGTARAAAKLMRKLGSLDAQESSFAFEQVENLADVLTSKKSGRTQLVLQTCPDRIHTIVPGVAVLVEIGRLFGSEKMWVSSYGVREGYACTRIVGRT